MTLHFNQSDAPTLGFEIELQLLNPETLDLIPKSQDVLTLCQEKNLIHVKAEIHQSMIEVDTNICPDVKSCRQNLEKTLHSLYEVVDQLNIRLSTTGTHPFQNWSDRLIFPDERYLGIQKRFRWLARRMSIFGLHVHVGVSSAEMAITITNVMTRFLPHMLALSANSPFWHGQNTGMQACRPDVISSFPFGGIPPYFANWAAFETYYQTLTAADAISSPKDLYWYVRPNLSFGTVELRICDAVGSIDEMMAILALTQCVVQKIEREPDRWISDPKLHWLAPDNLWIAARDGLKGMISSDLQTPKKSISEELNQLIDELLPLSHELNNTHELLYCKEIILQGNGATKQREVYKTSRCLKEVVNHASNRLRQSLNAGKAHDF